MIQRAARTPGNATGTTCVRTATRTAYATMRASTCTILAHSRASAGRAVPGNDDIRCECAKDRQGAARGAGYPRWMHHQPVALVTGANKGIGYAIARELAARGFTVLVGARDRARGEAAAAQIAGARAIALDVTRADSIAAAAAWIQRELGRLDVLVNNAAIARVST